MGDVPPQKQRRERVAHISNPATSGTQDAGKPSAYEGGQRGVQGGGAPHGGGPWGVFPHKTLKGASGHPLKPCHEWDPERWQTLSQRGWGK